MQEGNHRNVGAKHALSTVSARIGNDATPLLIERAPSGALGVMILQKGLGSFKLYHRVHVIVSQLVSTMQVYKFDQECQAHDFSAQFLNELCCGA